MSEEAKKQGAEIENLNPNGFDVETLSQDELEGVSGGDCGSFTGTCGSFSGSCTVFNPTQQPK